MIRVDYTRVRYDGPLYFRVDDHATENSDVCVAVSALASAAALYVKSVTGKEPDVLEDGLIVIDLKESTHGIAAVFDAIMLEISMLCEQYPDDIRNY